MRVYSHDISSRLIFLGPSSGGRRSNSPTVWDTRGLMGMRLCSRMHPRSCTNSPCSPASRTTPSPSCLMRPSRSEQNAGRTARLTPRKRTSSAMSSTVRLAHPLVTYPHLILERRPLPARRGRNCCQVRPRDRVLERKQHAQTAWYCSRWIPRGDWGCSSDPSGRSVSIHNAAYETTS